MTISFKLAFGTKTITQSLYCMLHCILYKNSSRPLSSRLNMHMIQKMHTICLFQTTYAFCTRITINMKFSDCTWISYQNIYLRHVYSRRNFCLVHKFQKTWEFQTVHYLILKIYIYTMSITDRISFVQQFLSEPEYDFKICP